MDDVDGGGWAHSLFAVEEPATEFDRASLPLRRMGCSGLFLFSEALLFLPPPAAHCILWARTLRTLAALEPAVVRYRYMMGKPMMRYSTVRAWDKGVTAQS